MSVLFTRRGAPPPVPKMASDYSVGDSVYLIENGANAEYLVVHQGLPDTTKYDASCNGTWLLRKDIYEKRSLNSTRSGRYHTSAMHTYLNSEFLALFGESVKSAIVQATIPYADTSGANYLGANGLSTKVFLLSALESGIHPADSTYLPQDGTALSYFSAMTAAIRIAYLSGTATNWWTRSPYTATTQHAWAIDKSGNKAQQYGNNSNGFRPAIIIRSDTSFNPDTNVIL